MADYMVRIQRDSPASRDLEKQSCAGRQLGLGPLIIRPTFVLNANGIEVGIDSRLQQVPARVDHNSRMERSVVLVYILMNLSALGNCIVRRLLARGIEEHRLSSREAAVNDVNHDGLRTEP